MPIDRRIDKPWSEEHMKAIVTIKARTGNQQAAAPKLLRTALLPAALLALVCSLLLLSSTALAAAPEAPVTSTPAKAITATSAVLEGTLNPGASAKAGWYFVYGTEIVCAADGASPVEPEVTGKALKEHIEVTGLEPHRKYTFCIIATNEVGEGTQSVNEASFETKAEAPSVLGESVYGIHATEAHLEAFVNPNNEPTGCKVEYGTSTSYGSEVPCEPATLGGYGEQGVGVTLRGLEEAKPYDYRLVVENATGASEATGNFSTYLAPASPEAKPAKPVEANSATLHGVLSPGKAGEPGTSYQFLYRQSATECKNGGGVTNRETAVGTASGQALQSVEAQITELLPGTTYTFCLRAYNEADEEESLSAPETFTTPATAPAISGEEASSVGPAGATVKGQIDPDGLLTSYHLEYVSEGQFLAHEWAEAMRIPNPDGELPASDTPVLLSESLGGLQPNTTYHFRFSATNTLGIVSGSNEELTTSSAVVATSSALPDGRVDELVTTAGNQGEPYVPVTPTGPPYSYKTKQPFQAAADGDAVAYMGEPADAGGSGNIGSGEGNQWLAKRTASGWVTNVITPGGSEPESAYQAFSENLSVGFLQTSLHPALATDAPAGEDCEVLYARDDETGTYRPLFTGADVTEDCGGPLFAGASEGDSHVIFQSTAPLTPSAVEATEVPKGHNGEHEGSETKGNVCDYGCNLYESSGESDLTLVNVLPGPQQETVPNATFGGYAGEHGFEASFSNAISSNGARIFWTDTQEVKNGTPDPDFDHVYVLENGKEEVQVSGAGEAEYWTATPDGRYAYYTEGGELWRFDTSTEAGSEPRKALASLGLNGENAGVLGVVGVGVAKSAEEDPASAYVYFVADGVLARNENANKETAEQGRLGENPNLYVLHEGITTFIATLSSKDDNLKAIPSGPETYGDWVAALGDRTAEVTSDGGQLVFESIRPLTGYDNKESAGASSAEVFLYAAETNTLACASCNPSGARPTYPESNEQAETKLPISHESTTQMRRWLSANGNRVFFESHEALSPQDSNGGLLDVYEWENEGEGSCTVQTPARLNRGCVFLLSGGNSDDDSYFVDADEQGNNVFFTHRGPLGGDGTPSDQVELYDARVDGGFSSSSLACTGTGCQGVPPAAPQFATPASVTFSGVGNFPPVVSPVKAVAKPLTRAQRLTKALKTCGKDRKKAKRAKCEKSARSKYGAKKTTKASTERRAK
jgi:hypothetical protein